MKAKRTRRRTVFVENPDPRFRTLTGRDKADFESVQGNDFVRSMWSGRAFMTVAFPLDEGFRGVDDLVRKKARKIGGLVEVGSGGGMLSCGRTSRRLMRDIEFLGTIRKLYSLEVALSEDTAMPRHEIFWTADVTLSLRRSARGKK